MLTTLRLQSRLLAVLGAPATLLACSGSTQTNNSETAPEVQVAAAPPPSASADEPDELDAPPARDPSVSHWQPADDGTRRGCTVEREVEHASTPSDFKGCPYTLYPSSNSTVALAVREPRPPRALPGDTLQFDRQLTQQARSQGEDRACCYHVRRTYRRDCPPGDPLCQPIRPGVGRPLLEGSAPILSASVERDDWQLRGGANVRGGTLEVAREWRQHAAAEHSSVASFARLHLQLLALGAPAALLREAMTAAQDEIRHARCAWSIAARCSGEPTGPGALAPTPAAFAPPASLAQLTRETFVEGCVGETVGALALARAAQGTSQGWLSQLLHAMAEDEARHAELAWRIVGWSVETGGSEVRAALLETVAEEAGREPELTQALHAPHWGLLGGAHLQRVCAEARQHVVLPCARLALARG